MIRENIKRELIVDFLDLCLESFTKALCVSLQDWIELDASSALFAQSPFLKQLMSGEARLLNNDCSQSGNYNGRCSLIAETFDCARGYFTFKLSSKTPRGSISGSERFRAVKLAVRGRVVGARRDRSGEISSSQFYFFARVCAVNHAEGSVISLARTSSKFSIPLEAEAAHCIDKRLRWLLGDDRGYAAGLRSSLPATPRWRESPLLASVLARYRRLRGLARKTVPSVRSSWQIARVRHFGGAASRPNLLFRTDIELITGRLMDQYADPFPFSLNGSLFILCEGIPKAGTKGVIVLMEIAEHGRVKSERVILDLPYHLSFPNPADDGALISILPECAAIGRIQVATFDRTLSRALSFEEVHLPHSAYRDTVVFFRDGIEWLFSSAPIEGESSIGGGLFAFYRKMNTAAWIPHHRNPILLDLRNGRAAGKVVVDQGKVIRLAQNCLRSYGNGISAYEIRSLSPTDFDEVLLWKIACKEFEKAIALHTCNFHGGYMYFDYQLE